MLEQRTRTVSYVDPRASLAAGISLSGLDWLRAIVDGTIAQPPISATLGFEITEATEGRVVFVGHPGEHVYNPMGSVHGGYAAVMLDSALGSAVMTRLDAKTAYTTAQLGVHLVRPILADTGVIRAIGTVVHVGRRVATASAEIVDSEGRLLAHGTTTCVLMPRGAA
jgi:uncharacterized protein (TIGR00369 family)